MASPVWPAAPACPAPAFPAPFFPNAPLVPPPSMAPVLPLAAAAVEKGFPDSSSAPPAWSADGARHDTVAAVCISRSTSAGSTSPRSSGDEESPGMLSSRSTPLASSSSGNMIALPEIQESVPFVVYNTFIEVQEQDSFELEGFFAQRQIQSCPASPYRELLAKTDEEVEKVLTAPQAVEASVPRVLRLADSLRDELPCSDLPSAGSEGHAQGSCKPCAFVHTKGCGNGRDCEFCHLCDAGARKRRQKERVSRWRDGRLDEMPWMPHA
mmetsp:Transcript_4353/g.7682  ORF Transcript_4353/g.7682 Transcript_4353/m.7682 type:complete len:268 (-) Transcript_4353:98-901(-)|eukprot:CAMPEP_0197648778 /NCGR_PEP_ID=MMETSP1338-20131121/27955_1 /TAXON_ID=43686 ORGANISM="Pelagodinium beii, Strain RCC1491" /NCGR_SAMPLE_ID=MMETSP1338 /ASSEMBLY_ACC=CAM_ASM_000754 /LENGTH=267 /DNA_ID=CAMNT_0043222833 /DNA_START=44 /DNA_END=847 /DNA_ORIENTATION=+